MSKELEHLEVIKDWANEHHNFKEVCGHSIPVEEALERLEAIDNAKHSEAFDCVEDIYRNGVFISDYDALGKQHPTNISPETNKSISEQCNTIKQALLKSQEMEKVFDIIKNKRVNIDVLDSDLYDYNYYARNWLGNDCELTQEEFDILKRYLGDE